MWTPRRRASPEPAPAPTGPSIVVALASGLAGWVGPLEGALDRRYEVSVGEPAAASIAVVDAVEPDRLAALRRLHPDTRIVVVSNRRDARVAELFDAGADAVLVRPDVRTLAAHVRALARRRDRPPGRAQGFDT